MTNSYKYFIETEVPSDELIISRTDLKGFITYANDVFANISGYSPAELIGKPHSIVRHPDMPSSVFKELWQTLKSGKLWSGYIKNLRKDGGYYWVYAEVSEVHKDGKLVEYKSLRAPVENEKKIELQNRYDKMKEKEEKICRIVANISVENYEKLIKLAKEEGIAEDKILDNMLVNSLF